MNKRMTREISLLNGILNGNTIIVSNSVQFILPPEYPFKAPILLIQSVDHIKFLSALYRKYFFFIALYDLPIQCICCSSITCLWSPCNTCKDVYDEYINYSNVIKTIMSTSCLFSSTPFDDVICSLITSFLL